MKTKMAIVFFITIGLVFQSGCDYLKDSLFSSGSHKKPVSPVPYTGQGAVYVQKNCCPCQSGGELTPLAPAQAKNYESQLLSSCPQIQCPHIYNCEDWKQKCQNATCSANVQKQINR